MVSRQREYARSRIQLEGSLSLGPMSLSAGPYYLGNKSKPAWGAQARATCTFYDYFHIEGTTSYDGLFHWRGQGQIGIRIPFGGKRSLYAQPSHSPSVAARSLHSVDRGEIIPVACQYKTIRAVHPVTQKPYLFWFVNNTSHSAGTFESPFATLLAAQKASHPYDILYLFPGDGTQAGMDSGVVLKEHQKIWGAGIEHILSVPGGALTIRAHSPGTPQITHLRGNGIVLASACEVSGLHIDAPDGTGILGGTAFTVNSTDPGITDTVIRDNILTHCHKEAIGLFNCQGHLLIQNNVLSENLNDGLIVSNDSVPIEASVIICNNQISLNHKSEYYAINVNSAHSTGNLNVIIHNNISKNNKGDGIFFGNNGFEALGGVISGVITGNSTTENAGYGVRLGLLAGTTGAVHVHMEDNLLKNNILEGLHAEVTKGMMCLRLLHNTSLGAHYGYYLSSTFPGLFQLEETALKSNVGTFFQQNISSVPLNTCQCD